MAIHTSTYRLYLILTFCFLTFIAQREVVAQTGIGNVLPDTLNSILDLRNLHNKSLRSPNAPGIMPTAPTGLLFFLNTEEKLFYNTTATGSYNGLTAWRYKFGSDTTSNTYFTTTGKLGIGISTPQRPLHIASTSNPMLLLEGSSSAKILLKTKSTTVSPYAIIGYENNNTFTISNSMANGKIEINVNNGGKFNVSARITENGRQVVPTGTIALWYGPDSQVPQGWALCNGSTYSKMDGSGAITTPNLVAKFPIGAGSSYSLGQTGGNETVTLTSTDQMPRHKHDVSNYTTSTDGSHSHGMKVDGGSTHSSGGNFRRDDGQNGSGSTNPAGNHSHSVVGSSGATGNSDPIENMPPYMCIRYIMKL